MRRVPPSTTETPTDAPTDASTADVPEAPPIAARPPTPEVEPEQTTDLALGNVFAAGFGVTRPEAHVTREQPASGGRAPYLSFYHPKQGVAEEVVLACKTEDQGVTVGMPYLGNVGEGTFARIDSAGFVLWGQHLPYWCTIDDSNQIVDAWLTPQAVFETKVDKKTGKEKSQRIFVDGLKMHGSCLAMILVLPGRKKLPEILQPATFAIADVQKNHQSSSILRAFDNAEKTKDPEVARKLGEIVSKAPPGLRVISRFLITPKPGKIVWALADSAASPINTTQMAAVNEWARSAVLQDERERIEEVFETRVAAIRTKAGETAERG